MFNGIRIAGTDREFREEWERREKIASGGAVPNSPQDSGLAVREYLGEDNGPANNVILNGDGRDCESVNRGGGL